MKLKEKFASRLNLKPNDIAHYKIVARNMAVEIVAWITIAAAFVFVIAVFVAVIKVAFFM